MGNREVLVDTTVMIDFLRKRKKERSNLWKLKEQEINCLASTITVFELYAGAITKKHLEDLKRLFKWIEIVSFTREIAQRAAQIYRDLKSKNQMIEFRDIFIGATALELKVPLVTLNKQHFKRIKGLELF